jgi:hypothetical protein
MRKPHSISDSEWKQHKWVKIGVYENGWDDHYGFVIYDEVLWCSRCGAVRKVGYGTKTVSPNKNKSCK